jgi:hypothetical protein
MIRFVSTAVAACVTAGCAPTDADLLGSGTAAPPLAPSGPKPSGPPPLAALLAGGLGAGAMASGIAVCARRQRPVRRASSMSVEIEAWRSCFFHSELRVFWLSTLMTSKWQVPLPPLPRDGK